MAKHNGVEVNDKVWRKMLETAKTLGQKVVKVGVIGVEAANETEDGITVGRLAGVHEFGAAIQQRWGVLVIPERSFIRAPLKANERAYSSIVEKYADRVLRGVLSEEKALALLGERAKGDMQKAIAKGIEPANAPATIEAKGSSKPLVDTGRLRSSITYAVVDKENV